MDDLITKRAKKLLALAERGVGGEAVNAMRLLGELLAKHGMRIEDLLDDNRKERVIPYKTADDMRLIVRILYNLVGSKSEAGKEARYNTKAKQLYIMLNDIEYIDLKSMIAFHRAQFRKERDRLLDNLYSAYVTKHRLYDPDYEDNGEPSKFTLEEIERILSMAKDLDNVSYRKQLE